MFDFLYKSAIIVIGYATLKQLYQEHQRDVAARNATAKPEKKEV